MKTIPLITTTLYQLIASYFEDRKSPPGQLIDVGGYRLHYYVGKISSSTTPTKTPTVTPTIVLEHSLGGIEGYLLAPEIAKIAPVFIYDRAGYGWSDHSPHRRTSEQIVSELNILLTKAGIEPPYILVGDSFGSYNVRLFAHQFPEKVVGMVLVDGLHEVGMSSMAFSLRALQLLFTSGFVMSTLGSILGIIRLLKTLGMFELIKPQLRKFPTKDLDYIKRSFCRPKHWVTMAREIINLDNSARQISCANNFGDLPLVSIKANSFFKPSLWTYFIPLKSANKLRDKMHLELLKISNNSTQLQASNSGHFVWVDEPEVIVTAIKMVLEKTNIY
ncbi:MAG: alpha/beta hydrolase [Scytonematopsis contorta HA4267-MV1]|jgi:pimeloyl-ACP methyl ester carboxylesterase|nr:alpha/beta hydrolase [Scytonematopsis contorta HA4267-MV1]